VRKGHFSFSDTLFIELKTDVIGRDVESNFNVEASALGQLPEEYSHFD